MPDTGFLVLSGLSIVIGACAVLVPHSLARISERLNRTVAAGFQTNAWT